MEPSWQKPAQKTFLKRHTGKKLQKPEWKYLTQMETRFIHNSVNLSRANAIMDIGAEAGRFSQASTDKEATVVSLDINSYGLKRLQLKTKQVNVIQADARKSP